MRAKKAEEEKGAFRNTCRLSKEPATKNLQPQYTARSRQTNTFYVVHVFQKAFIFLKVPVQSNARNFMIKQRVTIVPSFLEPFSRWFWK